MSRRKRQRFESSDAHGISTDLKSYYARRASEYERIYGKPERQYDLERLRNMVPGAFAGHDVLEIACGTGYWTQFVAQAAWQITALDYNPEVLEIARQKYYASCRVLFQQADAYQLTGVNRHFSAGFHGFWWSHVPQENLGAFLDTFHSRLEPGAVVVIIENRYVEGSSTPISREDEHNNTYQLRNLSDGTIYEVLKNFHDETALQKILANKVVDIEYTALKYYWFLKYKVKR